MVTSDLILVFLFGFLFSAFRELSEHAKENGFKGYPKWWNTATSHRNKHEWGQRFLPFLPPKVSKWLFFSPLVWLTDAEHFFQMIALLSVLAALLVTSGDWYSVGAFYIGNALTGAIKPSFGLK